MVALFFLTSCVWVLMYARRLAEITRRKIDYQTLGTSESGAGKLENVSAADNFRNLTEAPLFFYVVCISLFVTAEVSILQLVLAWVYVFLRLIHSVIHVSYNKVLHRWFVYVLSCGCLFLMWLNFAIALYW